MLAKRFEHILHDLGMAGLEHPLFYHAPVGIRFKIGGEEPIYLDRRAAKLKTNPAYVQGALDRAAAIYRALPAVPDLLRIDGYPDEEPAESLLTVIRQRVGLPVPDEQLSATEQDEDGDTHWKAFLTFCHTFRAFRHKQDSTLVAEQTAISSIFAFFVSIYSVFVERPG